MTVYELVLEGRQGGKDMLNVFHYDDGGAGAPDWADVAAVFEGHIDEHLAPLCNSRATWTGITVREDIPGGVGIFTPFPGGMITGSLGGSDTADVLAMQVKKLCSGTVRPTYGWFMQGGLSSAATDGNNTWEALFQAGVAAYAEDIRQITVAGPVTLAMVVKASNPTAPNTQAYSPVTSFQIRSDPRTQRTRLAESGS